MKDTYLAPDVKVISLAFEQGLLYGSNDGFPVNPVDPGFAPEFDFLNF